VKGLKLRKIVGLFALVLCLASVLVAHVWKQNTYVRLSIESARLGKECARLRNGIALLELEAGELRKLSRIEALARGRLGLELAKTPVPVYPEGGWPGEGKAEERSGQMARKGGKIESGKLAWLTRGL
jgi:cell division protein FtsL